MEALRPISAALAEGVLLRPLIKQEEPQSTEQPHLFAIDYPSEGSEGCSIYRIGDIQVAVGIVGPIPRATNTSNKMGAIFTNQQKKLLGDNTQLSDTICTMTSRQHINMEVSVQTLTNTRYKTVEEVIDEKHLTCINDRKNEIEQKFQIVPAAVLEVLKSVICNDVYSVSILAVFITILSVDGDANVLPCVFNALSLALRAAHVKIRAPFGSSIGYIVKLNDQVTIHSTLSGYEIEKYKKQAASITSLVVCLLSGTNDLAYIAIKGADWSGRYAEQLTQLVMSSAETIANEITKCNL